MIPPDVEARIGSTDFNQLMQLLDQLDMRRARNDLRTSYYDMKNLFRDLGIAIPPQLRSLQVAMGWPAKAVDLLARRVRLDGFVLPGGNVDDWGIPQAWTDNRMESEAPQATVSALISSPAFILTHLGDTANGEPEIMFTIQDANSATALWEPARRGLKAALAVLATDLYGPSKMVYTTPQLAIGLTRNNTGAGTGAWDVNIVKHGLGRVPVEPLVYKPRLSRPFGSTRITRAVMSYTDSAMRTIVRAEVGAEFYSSPQRYLLGADESMFVGPDGVQKSTWDLVMGRILAVPALESDDGFTNTTPSVGQFPQITMQPHTDQLAMWATLFAGEAGIPVSSLGIVQDNPASAEAIYAAKEDLVIEAEGVGEGFTPAYIRSMLTGIQLRDKLDAVPVELRKLGVRWRDPSTPSKAAATDAVMKLVSAGVLPADSDVALEMLGFDDTTISRIAADRRRTSGSVALRSISAAAQRTIPVVSGDDITDIA